MDRIASASTSAEPSRISLRSTGDGTLHLAKADTVSASRRGVLDALAGSDVSPGSVGVLVHGTTIVINAVTERSGARTALLTTSGFRDVLEIGRANRPDLYNLSYRKPPPFVPRRLRFEVAERTDHVGRELTPLRRGGAPGDRRRARRNRRRGARDLLPPRLGGCGPRAPRGRGARVSCSPASRSSARAR